MNKTERIPANADALATITKTTLAITAAVPIEETAVCATVLIALTPAALIQSLKLYFSMVYTSKSTFSMTALASRTAM